MPEREPAAAPPAPFDQGVFLLHYNRGREAFQEGRYAEARRELEQAQRLRRDDADVLNLLGMVYFKTNAFPEAEVIYRRLVTENPNVFILHSNLGLILFKQGKLDEAQRYLLRAVELRPNYAKSHLYLGLLYRQKRKLPEALEHLRFAGADKIVREVEAEMKPAAPSPPPQQPEIVTQKITMRTQPAKPRKDKTTQKIRAVSQEHLAEVRQLVTQPGQIASPAHTAARKLQDAVDETPLAEEKRINLERKIEGASKTF